MIGAKIAITLIDQAVKTRYRLITIVTTRIGLNSCLMRT